MGRLGTAAIRGFAGGAGGAGEMAAAVRAGHLAGATFKATGADALKAVAGVGVATAGIAGATGAGMIALGWLKGDVTVNSLKALVGKDSQGKPNTAELARMEQVHAAATSLGQTVSQAPPVDVEQATKEMRAADERLLHFEELYSEAANKKQFLQETLAIVERAQRHWAQAAGTGP